VECRGTQPRIQPQTPPQTPQDAITASGDDLPPDTPEAVTAALQDESDSIDEAVPAFTAPNTPNIRIEGNAVDFVYEQNESGISIYINANAAPKDESAAVPVMANMPTPEGGGQPEAKPVFPLYQIAVVGILLGILACLFFRMPKLSKELDHEE
jgi:hypothetical protein